MPIIDERKNLVAAIRLAAEFELPLDEIIARLEAVGVTSDIFNGTLVYPAGEARAVLSQSRDDPAAAPVASPLRPRPEHIAKLAAGTGDELPSDWRGRFQGILG